MFVANYSIVDWGPYGMWLSNCSDDINSTKVWLCYSSTWKITNSSITLPWQRTPWLAWWLAPPRPQIVLNKQIGPEQWDIWKLATNIEKLGTWTRYFTGTIVIVTIPSIIIIHVLYKLAFPFLLFSPKETYNLIILYVLWLV